MRIFTALFALLAATACGGSTTIQDAGPTDAGPLITDGGGLGSPCTSLDQCGGNPLYAYSYDVICAARVCTSAGGGANSAAVSLAVEVSPIPSYLQVYLLSPELVSAGTLDCPTLMQGVDAGTLNPSDTEQVNPLLQVYEQNVPATVTSAQNDMMFEASSAASGPDRVLYIEGYFGNQSDGGAALVGRCCTTFSDTDAGIGMASLTMKSLW